MLTDHKPDLVIAFPQGKSKVILAFVIAVQETLECESGGRSIDDSSNLTAVLMTPRLELVAIHSFFTFFLFAVPAHAIPNCALIDSTKLPVTALLETRLLNSDGATWVERSQIDRILAEQQLQNAFGAAAVQARATLGEALKADVLILLRSAKNPQPNGPAIIDCVVCETQRGLRLKTMSLAIDDKNQEETADALEKLVLESLKKYAEKIETIVAVPPFLSEDLGFEFNYLQSAFAKVVEERLLAQPGLLVVELGEAQAIAKELVLAGDTSVTSNRQPPLYVVGRYRHDGIGKQKSVRMSLRLMKSEEQITLKGIKDLPPRDVPAWIIKKTDELLPLLGDKQIAATGEFSAEREAAALANRARQFMKVGNWPEAQSLLEAALLLRPDEGAILTDTIVTTTQLIPISNQVRDGEKVKSVVANCNRGLEHLERYLRDAPNIKSRTQLDQPPDITLDLIHRITQFLRRAGAKDPADAQEVVQAARKLRFDTLIRIAYSRHKAGFRDRQDQSDWDALAVSDLSEKERYAVILRLADEWRDLTDLPNRLMHMTFSVWVVDSPEYRRFLETLKASPRQDLQAAATTIQHRYEWLKLHRDKLPEPGSQEAAVPSKVDAQLERVSLRLDRRLGWINNTFPAEEGEDIFWSNGTLGKLEQPDQIKVYYRYKDLYSVLDSAAYDGRYTWIAGRKQNNAPTLLAIDSQGQAIEFSSDDGLPKLDEPQPVVKLAPVAPGKICVVGYAGRSWVALAEIGAGGTRKFDIFFEAREAVTGADESHATNPKVVFSPTALFTIKNPRNGEVLIVGGRYSISDLISIRPLIIDPQTKTVRVSQFTCGRWANGGDRWVTQSEDSLYFSESDASGSLNLMRVRWPGNEKEKAVANCPQGQLVFDKRGLHVIGKKWWLADVSTGTVKKLVDSPPWFFRNPFAEKGLDPDADWGVDSAKASELKMVYPTAHYGVLVKASKGQDESGASYFRLK